MPRHLVAPSILLCAILVWALVAPAESVLGSGIRWVYLHVAFTWGGTSLVNVAGLFGIVLILYPKPGWAEWVLPTEGVALSLYAVGFLLSLVSAWSSWGGVLWQEPRVVTSILVMGSGLGVVAVLRNLTNPRLIGLTAIVFSGLLSYQLAATRVVFHPDDPVDTTESVAIRVTFYGLAVLATALGVALVLAARRTFVREAG